MAFAVMTSNGQARALLRGSQRPVVGLGLIKPITRMHAPVRTSVVVQARQTDEDYKAVAKGKGYDSSATKVNPATAAFTRRREVFVGRLAMTGFFAACVGEILTGKGPIGQLALETRLPIGVVNLIIYGFVLFSFFTALSPGSPTWSRSNQQDVNKRPTGANQDPNINAASNPLRLLGLEGFEPGFTKANELFTGRLAMLGFASALVGEKLTGKGPLGQLGWYFDVPYNPTYAAFALALWVGLWGLSAVGYNNFGQTEGDEEIY